MDLRASNRIFAIVGFASRSLDVRSHRSPVSTVRETNDFNPNLTRTLELKQHTIIFVPHARAKFRKLRFSSLQAGLLFGSLGLLTLAGLFAVASLSFSTVDEDQLHQLQAENESLREVNQNFETSIRSLETQVQDYQQRIHKLAIVAGLSELSPSAEVGIGGSEPLTGGRQGLEEDLVQLQTALSEMGEGMDLLSVKLEEHRTAVSSIPAIAPAKGLFTSSYGFRKDPFHGTRAFHQGIDITAPRGQDIVATGDGLVIKAERMQGLGKAVYISHGQGIVTRYGHMSKIVVEAGERVERGQLIGHVGSTGRSTGNHVHYEIHVDGKATNPLAYILNDFN